MRNGFGCDWRFNLIVVVIVVLCAVDLFASNIFICTYWNCIAVECSMQVWLIHWMALVVFDIAHWMPLGHSDGREWVFQAHRMWFVILILFDLLPHTAHTQRVSQIAINLIIYHFIRQKIKRIFTFIFRMRGYTNLIHLMQFHGVSGIWAEYYYSTEYGKWKRRLDYAINICLKKQWNRLHIYQRPMAHPTKMYLCVRVLVCVWAVVSGGWMHFMPIRRSCSCGQKYKLNIFGRIENGKCTSR